MPDWERLVAARLARTPVAPEVRREVIAEIAAHLEEHYLELVRTGSADAETQTLAQIADWRALRRNIRRSKEDRMGFARKVLMPGVAAMIAAFAALRLFVYLLVAPTACGPAASTGLVEMTCISVSADGPAYLPWLGILMVTGAFTAWLARWMGGRPIERLVAAAAPALYLAVETLVMSLVDAFYWRIPIYWVFVPAIVCAIGALPFLTDRRNPIDSESVPAHS
jgi:hypothetical protein